MSEPETISESIDQSAIENVRRVTTGNVSIEGHSLREQIEADKYLKQDDDTAKALPAMGLIRRRQVPGGCG